MLIAQLTDTHIRGNAACAFGAEVDTSDRLTRAVCFLQQIDPRPEVILATGDLADTAHPDDYEHLVSLLAPLDAPIFPIPGNHDARGPLRDAFAETRRRATGKYIQYIIDDYPVRLIALDTLEDGWVGGRLCGERLAWIESSLAQSDRPTILFMHHPPYHCGAHPNNDMHCEGADKLARLVAAHGNVAAVLCGHLHRWTLTRWAGTVACTAPATAPALELNLHGRGPDSWVESPPMVGLHLWREAGGLVSHVIDVDELTHLHRLSAPL